MDRRIGRYEIQEELGRGAFGRVYRAFDPSVKRAVAIKILASESSPEILERFRAEAGTTGNLTHNNIVTVYEYAEHEGMPYLAMELLEGRTLQKLIDEHEPLTLLEKVDIMSQIAEGLAAAHDRGVIHRDIKPGNIMVLPSGTAKIMDFGIARVMDRDSTRRTRQGDLVGTILYMSPEQFQGLDPDRLSDVFAYGVMFYELLTGEHPFSRYPFPVSDVGTVMYRITTAEPPPLREKAPDCPEALEHLVQRIMAKDREIRARGFEEILIDSAPVLHELKSIRAHQLMDGLGGLIEAGKIDAAQAQIRQVLELDPFNTEARRWRRELQEKADQALVKTKVDGLLREGDAHMAARRFQQAVQSYEASVHADKSNAGAKDRLERAKAALEVSRKVSRGLSEARWEMQQGRLDAAAAKVSEALAADPHNTEAARLRETIERQVTEARWEALLAKAEDERSRQAYGDALQTLSEIAAEPAIAGRVEMARESIEAERAEFERKRRAARLQTGLAQTRQALQAQRLEEAEASAEALAAEFPGEEAPRAQLNEVRELQAARRRAAAIGELAQTARGLIEAKRFDEAVGALEGGIGQYRDAGLQRLLETALSLKADHQRALGIAGAIEHAQQLRQTGEFEKALDLLRQSAKNFGADPGLDDCRRQVQREKDQRDRAAARERAIADIRHLAGGQKFQEAVAVAEKNLGQYPADPELTSLLEAARRGLSEQFERAAVARALEASANFEKRGLLDQALREVQGTLDRHPNAGELAAAVARLRTRIAEETARRKKEELAQAFEAALKASNWSAAGARLEAGKRDFPGDARWEEFDQRLQASIRSAKFAELDKQVRTSLDRKDFQAANQALDAAREEFSSDPAWTALAEETARRKKEDLVQTFEAALKASNWNAAGDRLDAAKRAFPGDARWDEFDQRLRASVRNAKFAELDKQVRASLDRKDFQAANQALEVAREEFSSDPAWTALAEETARRKKEDLVQAFEAALKASNWTAASASLEAAKRVFPGDARWEEFDRRLRASVRNAKFAELDKQVRTSLDRKDFQAANQALEVAREEFSNDLAWTALAEETVRRRKEDLVQAFEAAVKASNWSAASTSLEAAKRDFPSDARWEEFDRRLRASVRNAKFAELDKQVRTSLDRKDFQAANQALEVAREEFASDAAWIALAQETAIQAFETALKEANWTAAAARLDTARRDFPGDSRWEEFDKRIRTAKLAELDKQVRTSLERKDFQAATQALDGVRDEFSNDPAWIALKQDLDRRRDYEAGIEEARRARQDKQYETAEAKLQTLIAAGPVDGRAQAALDELRAERYWPQWLDETLAQRREARRLSSSGDSSGAARLLEAFKKRFALYAEELFRQAAAKEAEAYTAVLAKAEKLRATSDYPAAEKLLREAIEIETGEPDGRARQLLAAIVQQRQQAEAIAAGLAQAAELRAKKDLAGALAVIDQLLRQHPQHAALTRDRSITMALLEEVWRREYAASLEEATKAEAGGDFAGARQILEKLVARNPPDDRARRALASVTQELDRQHREQTIATGRAEAALLKAGGDLAGALAILEKLLARYPDSPETRQELEKVRQQLAAQQARAEAIAKGRAEAARLRAKDPVAAAQILDALLHQYPGSPELLQDRAATEQAIQAARARDYEAALRDAEKARSKGTLEAAQEILRRLISQGPLDARAEQALTRINQDLERKQHEEALSQGRREAARLLQKLDFPAAIALLGKLLQSHPESKELAADLAAARVADERAQRTRAYEQGLEEASQARGAERYDQAEELLRKLIEAGAPDNRARDTLKAIRSEQSRKIAAAQRQAQKQAPQPQRKPEVISIAVHPPPATEPKKGLPIPAIAGGAALILIIGLWLAFRGGKPVTHVDLIPSELSFNARAGADGADAQEVTFGKVNDGLDRLDLQPSEPWITAEVREQSEGREHVAVQVRPKGLAAGSYSGNLRIAFRGGNIPAETVAVKLVIAPAAGSVGNTGNTGSTGGGAAVALQAAPASLDFQYKDGDPQPGPKKIIVQGGNFHAESGAAWLAVRASGNTVTAAVNPQNMLVGLHTASLYLRPDKGALIAVPVRLTIAAAQEFTSGAEAPIEILRWRGSLEPGATLTIQGSTASIGELAAGELPGSPIKLVSVGRPGQTNPAQPEPLRVTAPSQANGYSLKVQNAGTEAETSLIIRFRPGR